MDWVQAGSVAASMAAVDWAWARYAMALADRRAVASSLWAVAILLPSGWAIMSYVHDPMMLVPAAVGAFVGTYVSVKFKGDKQ